MLHATLRIRTAGYRANLTGVIGPQLHGAAVRIERVFYGALLVVAAAISTLPQRRTT